MLGVIYSPQHGDTAFTVPMFDEFMPCDRRLGTSAEHEATEGAQKVMNA